MAAECNTQSDIQPVVEVEVEVEVVVVVVVVVGKPLYSRGETCHAQWMSQQAHIQDHRCTLFLLQKHTAAAVHMPELEAGSVEVLCTVWDWGVQKQGLLSSLEPCWEEGSTDGLKQLADTWMTECC